MTDIVDRLRDKRSVDGSSVMFELPEAVIDLAIAEIMRLRHIIEEYSDALPNIYDGVIGNPNVKLGASHDDH